MTVQKDYFPVSPVNKIYYEVHCSSSSTSSVSSTKLIMIMGACATLRHFDEYVEYLLEHYPSAIEILIYDHRGIGYSKGPTNERQTTSLLANDAYRLIDHVWGDQTPVHVLGVSLGGMIAQELAVLLIRGQRLLSLYLGVTTRGTYIRPLALLPKCAFSRIILPLFVVKSDNERMIRSMLPNLFNEIEEEEKEDLIRKWFSDFNKWFIFPDLNGCTQHSLAVCSHYLTNEHAQQIRNSPARITVQISMQDKVVPPRQQRQLAKLLNAKTLVFESGGHMLNKQSQIKAYEGVLQHLLETNSNL